MSSSSAPILQSQSPAPAPMVPIHQLQNEHQIHHGDIHNESTQHIVHSTQHDGNDGSSITTTSAIQIQHHKERLITRPRPASSSSVGGPDFNCPSPVNTPTNILLAHRRTASDGMAATTSTPPSSTPSVSPSTSNAPAPFPSSTSSMGSGTTTASNPPPIPPPRGRGVGMKKRESRRSDWEILEGLKQGETYKIVPKKFEGFVLKKRKWPLKGYHKRYFLLDKGLILYGKTGWDVTRGKIHGTLDAGLSVITTRVRDGRIDIDAEDCIFHIKIKPKELYLEWLEQLKQHRLYRQDLLANKQLPAGAGASGTDAIDGCPVSPHMSPLFQNHQTLQDEKLHGIDKDINLVDKDISNLEGILHSITQPQSSKKEDPEKEKLKDFIIVAQEVVVSFRGIVRSINRNLSAREVESGASTLRLALNQALQENAELKSRLNRIRCEAEVVSTYDRPNNLTLKHGHGGGTPSDTIRSYGSTMSNNEYYDALDYLEKEQIVDEDRTSSDDGSVTDDEDGEADSIASEVSEPPKFEHDTGIPVESGISSADSNSSSTNGALSPRQSIFVDTFLTKGRRARLPSPAPSETPSLWGILKKNIGKDLSRVSMPVTLNEPLGVLQRMCEELEYSELLDAAAKENDSVDRLALIAAFAVSGYSSIFWRTHKPFNPLLGETYECVREDKGFRYVAEQVSHHPPLSASYAEGNGWIFWQETQPKTKFWGKSMEIHPIGEVHIVITKTGEHYSYNKATSCVHNLFSAPSRWVDLYGDVAIKTNGLTANLTFLKASYWSARKHEVFGTITSGDGAGTTLRNLFGHWNEAFYVGQPPSAKCIWRMGTMPEDHPRYYGFTRFAIELNELNAEIEEKIPISDTRLRPDQRLLEEGNLIDAEKMKLVIEQKQRDRRKLCDEQNNPFIPLWFQKSKSNSRNGEEQWEFNGRYWESRTKGFKDILIEPLW